MTSDHPGTGPELIKGPEREVELKNNTCLYSTVRSKNSSGIRKMSEEEGTVFMTTGISSFSVYKGSRRHQ